MTTTTADPAAEFRYAYRVNEHVLLDRPYDSGSAALHALVEDTCGQDALNGDVEPGTVPRSPQARVTLTTLGASLKLVHDPEHAGTGPALDGLAQQLHKIAAVYNGRRGFNPDRDSCAHERLRRMDPQHAVHWRRILDDRHLLGVDWSSGAPSTITISVNDDRAYLRLDDGEHAAFLCGQLAGGLQRAGEALGREHSLWLERLQRSASLYEDTPPRARPRRPVRCEDDIPF